MGTLSYLNLISNKKRKTKIMWRVLEKRRRKKGKNRRRSSNLHFSGEFIDIFNRIICVV